MPRALLPPARRQLKLTACDLFEVVDWLKVMKNLFISNAFATSATALSAFLISTAAIAKPIKLPTTTVARKTTIIYMTTFPPPEFDKPFTGKVTIWQVNSVDDIQTKYCMAANTRAGCSVHPIKQPAAPYCLIWILNDAGLKRIGVAKSLVLRHELAHCNGWPKDHPNGRKVPVDKEVSFSLPPDTTWVRAYPPLVCLTPEGKEESCQSRQPVLTENPWATILKQKPEVDCARFAGWHFCAKED
jgi:hypothetical protein